MHTLCALQAGKADSAALLSQVNVAIKRSVMEAEAERRLLDAQVVQETNANGAGVVAAALYMELANLSMKLLWHMDEMDVHHEEHEQLQENLEAARRAVKTSTALLRHRRSEMQNLTTEIESHRLESQILRKVIYMAGLPEGP